MPVNNYLQSWRRSYIVKIRMDTDTHYKNRIGQRLTTILLDAYENGLLPAEKVSYIAGVIREELAPARTSSEVFAFVEMLAAEWPIFESVLGEPTQRIVKNVNRRYLEQLATK